MPAQYEAIRDKFIAKGMGEKEAKKRAAMIFNSLHPDKPLIRYIQEEKGRKKK
jgi:hypothetical protein